MGLKRIKLEIFVMSFFVLLISCEKSNSENKLVLDKRYQKIDQLEQRVIQREEKLDNKFDQLDEQRQGLKQQEKERENRINDVEKSLTEIAKISREEAEKKLLSSRCC